MACLGAIQYDPAVSVSKVTTAALAMTALDTTNLRLTFTAPSNGAVLVRMQGCVHGATTFPQLLLGVLDGATVRGRVAPWGNNTDSLATHRPPLEAFLGVSGLVAGRSFYWEAGLGVETVLGPTGL